MWISKKNNDNKLSLFDLSLRRIWTVPKQWILQVAQGWHSDDSLFWNAAIAYDDDDAHSPTIKSNPPLFYPFSHLHSHQYKNKTSPFCSFKRSLCCCSICVVIKCLCKKAWSPVLDDCSVWRSFLLVDWRDGYTIYLDETAALDEAFSWIRYLSWLVLDTQDASVCSTTTW